MAGKLATILINTALVLTVRTADLLATECGPCSWDTEGIAHCDGKLENRWCESSGKLCCSGPGSCK